MRSYFSSGRSSRVSGLRAGRVSTWGNVSNADIDTTDKDVPFYFTNGLGKFAGPVPEPASLSLLAFGGGLIWWALRWRSARVRG